MQVQVKTWGNSQGIRISKDILQETNIAVNDVLDVKVADGMITLVKPFRHKTLEERAAEFDGKSKDFFNQTGEIVGCPIFQDSTVSPLHIKVRTDGTEGYVQCEKLALLDLSARSFFKIDGMPKTIKNCRKEYRWLEIQ